MALDHSARPADADATASAPMSRPASPVADAFARFCGAVVRRLPFGLARVVPPTLLGFALINSTTFTIDLLLLTAIRDGLGLPIPVAVSIAYGIALSLAFVLNRMFNFRSHAAVGRQAGLYVVVVAINYVALVLGVTTGLAALGVDYQFARVLAGLSEAVFMYCAMRWVVFRRRPERADGRRRSVA